MDKHKINIGKYTDKQNHNVKYKQVNLIRNNNNVITQCNSSSSNNVVTVVYYISPPLKKFRGPSLGATKRLEHDCPDRGGRQY